MTSNPNSCELNIRIPFDSKANAETICEVLKVDSDIQDRFIKQEFTVDSNNLCVHLEATKAKDLRSGSSSFFESFLLCNEIIKEFADKPTS